MENKPPHVVIMDFKIGGEGGAKYVNWLLAATTPRRIPVILIVDEANAWQVANHEDKGVYGVLVSPFRMTDLCAMAKNAAAAGERTSSSGSFNPVG